MEQHREALGARALEKALDLLFSFQPDSPEQSLFQISRRLRFPPSTTRRLLKTMMSRRLVQQDPITKLYRLGPGVFYLASVAKEGLDVRRIALPVMEKLRDLTGENTTLHELRDGKRVCIEKVESKQVLRDTILIGDQFPAHCGASGKVLLAYLPAEELKGYFDSTHPLRGSDFAHYYRSPETICGAAEDKKTGLRIQLRRESDGRPLCYQRAHFRRRWQGSLQSDDHFDSL